MRPGHLEESRNIREKGEIVKFILFFLNTSGEVILLSTRPPPSRGWGGGIFAIYQIVRIFTIIYYSNLNSD
jgi:hypothetical protein